MFIRFLTLALVAAVFVTPALAQKRTNANATTRQASTLLSGLPPSDLVALIKIRRVIDEAFPKLLAENPAKVAEVNAELAKFKTDTGVDIRSFEQLALGLQYTYPSDGITKIKTVALARGTFNSGAIVAAGRLAANGKYQERKYEGKTIYVFTLDRVIKLAGLWDVKVRDLAITSIDSNTLALGDLEAVQSAIDSNKSRKHANPELVALASRDPNAIVGFGGDISEELMQNLRTTNDTIARELTAVRKVYGSLGMTSSDLELTLAARTVDADSAKNLGETVEGLKALAGLFVGRLSAVKGALARTALSNLKITTLGNELQIKTAVAQSQVSPLVGGN